MAKTWEQTLQTKENELGEKFEQDLKQAKKENKEELNAKYKNRIDQLSQHNTSLHSNYDSIKTELDQANEENKKKDIEIEELKNNSGTGDLKKLSRIVSNIGDTINSESKIEVRYRNQEDKDALKLLSSNKLPAVKRVTISHLWESNEDLKSFFKNSWPPTLSLFWLNNICNLVNVRYYIEDLKQWLESTLYEIYLFDLKICSEELNTIIKCSSQCNTLIISSSMIDASRDWDFIIDTNYKISNLSFQHCGNSDRSNWYDRRHELVKILKAIKASGLKISLKKISLYHHLLGSSHLDSLDKVRKVAKEAKLDTKLIVYEQWKPTEG